MGMISHFGRKKDFKPEIVSLYQGRCALLYLHPWSRATDVYDFVVSALNPAPRLLNLVNLSECHFDTRRQ